MCGGGGAWGGGADAPQSPFKACSVAGEAAGQGWRRIWQRRAAGGGGRMRWSDKPKNSVRFVSDIPKDQ